MNLSNNATRMDVLNFLIEKFGYKNYLEIGVQSGACFITVKAPLKVGVDPNPTSQATLKMTSDDFFAQNRSKGKDKQMFDLIFIDGLHEAPQVYRDIINALEVLNDGGTIVCHDMLPSTEERQMVPRMQAIWNGDCWKAFVQLRASREDLAMATIESDEGLGIIMVGEQELINIENIELNWKSFCENSRVWMNPISVQEFQSICDSIAIQRTKTSI